MSLKPQPIDPVPEETARVARAAFPKSNPWISLRDQLGTIFEDASFASLFPSRGQPAQSPWRLALITILQFAEGLSDRQAADAVRSRIDWKYLLSLDLTDPGFDSSVLCEFRARLIEGEAENILLEAILNTCRQRKLLSAGGKQRTDSTHLLAAIRTLNRLENVAETLRHALNSLAVAAPQWLIAHAQAQWADRYGPRVEEYRLPKGEVERRALAEIVGADGYKLLDAIDSADSPPWLREIPALETLRRVWIQQYYLWEGGFRWRTTQDGQPPASLLIHSPHDPEARYSQKRSTTWVGYKVHVSESCDQEAPRIITQVETTKATKPDQEELDELHRALAEKDLLPRQHIVDSGYVDAELLVRSSKEFGVELCGPTRPDTGWQSQAGGGFAARDFKIDWKQREATCPAGRLCSSWQEATNRKGKKEIRIKFSVLDCRRCERRGECTRTASQRRILTILPEEEFRAMEEARKREKTQEYKKLYAKRAGVEGSLSQGVRRGGMRYARYIGMAKTHLQNVATAAAINLVRIVNWLEEVPLAKTRRSSFAKLMRAEAIEA